MDNTRRFTRLVPLFAVVQRARRRQEDVAFILRLHDVRRVNSSSDGLLITPGLQHELVVLETVSNVMPAGLPLKAMLNECSQKSTFTCKATCRPYSLRPTPTSARTYSLMKLRRTRRSTNCHWANFAPHSS